MPLLKGQFTLKAAIGWIGPILVGALPGAATWFITQSVFGVGIETAGISGIATALLIGVIGNITGTEA